MAAVDTRLLDGSAAMVLGMLAGGCREAWVTSQALASTLASTLAARLPGVGGQMHSLPTGAEPGEWRADGPGDRASAGEPIAWVCAGAEAPALLRAGKDLPPGAVVVVLPPSPGLTELLSAAAPRYIWAPGSSRMAYRLAAAACREAGQGSGPCCILLDGELPPETVVVPPDQIPGLEAPTPGTGSRDPARTGTRSPWVPGTGAAAESDRATLAPGESRRLVAATERAPRAGDLKPYHQAGSLHPELLLVGTGTTFGELARAWTELLATGRQVAHLHLRQLRPLPDHDLDSIWQGARTVVVQEPPGGGLAAYLEELMPGARATLVVRNLDQLAATLQQVSPLV